MKDEELKGAVFNLIKNKKFQIALAFILLLVVILSSSAIRTSNLHLLKDSTTGESIPLALDPFYFMRIAETIVDNNGNLPDVDPLRSPSINVPWHPEILPEAIVGIYNTARIFNPSVTIQYASVISPVVFFIFGIILFFALSWFLSGKKSIALLSSVILAYTPVYLYRTMAGFSDHEAIGMIGIFSFFLAYAISLKYFEKSWRNVFICSIVTGLTTALVLATWGGAITFVLTIMPFAFLLYWLFAKKDVIKSFVFYTVFLISAVISPVFFGFSITSMLNIFTWSYGLLVPFVFVFILFDIIFLKVKKLSLISSIKENRVLYSLGSTIIIGIVGLKIIGRKLSQVLSDIWIKLINPFGGSDRLGATVAENSQPYLTEWISANGHVIFWLFIVGVLIVGLEFVKNAKNKRFKFLFVGSWALVVSGILFSRISATSQIFNGTSFISSSFYLISLLIFGSVIFVLAAKEKINCEPSCLLMLAIFFFVLINGRSAARVFFLLAPFVSLSASYGLGKIYDYAKTRKEEVSKLIFWIIFGVACVGIIFSINEYYQQTSTQAINTGPSANTQWQQAMEWTRDNTQEGDIFVHWWDYGYWVQSLGKRPTVTDGGHSGGIQADHYIGRYVLTTPEPASALSYMKTWNVSYLLIDQSDLGKYPAYSRIGGGAKDSDDRLSAIPVIPLDERQTRETSTGITMVFSGGSYISEDIIYENDDGQIFLPRGKAAILGMAIDRKIEEDGSVSINQPIGIYSYNNAQNRIPLRYVYYEDQLIDYGSGYDAVAFIIPSFNGQSINSMGASVYLSSKVSKSLFAQLFLMDDAFGNYPTIELAHTEPHPFIEQLRGYGYTGGDFVYYGQFLGPIKIWDVEYPVNTPTYEEFKDDLGGEYAKFDEVFY